MSQTQEGSYCYDSPSMYSIKNITYFRVLFYFHLCSSNQLLSPYYVRETKEGKTEEDRPLP